MLVKKNLIVVVVSGYAPQQKSIESMQIMKWFTKPYDKNQLDIELQKALHKLRNASGEAEIEVSSIRIPEEDKIEVGC